jgi:uncharacterized tellurite resistance protein B-like protein
MNIHESFSEFVLFLYVHISHADNQYDPAEMAAIKSKMSTLFPAGTDLERKLYLAIREYNSFDKSRLSDFVKDSFRHFGLDKKSTVYADAFEIIRADGRIDQHETKALDALKQLLDI